MKMKKLLTVVLLCGALTVSALAGCKVRDPQLPPMTAETVRIGAAVRGYGSAWLTEMCKAYEKATGKTARLVVETKDMNASFVNNTVQLGPQGCDFDLFITMNNTVFNSIAKRGTIVSGYDPVWADLSDVYASPAEGFEELKTKPDLKIKDLFPEFIYDAMTYPVDNKQYAIPYVVGVNGFLYNRTLFEATNAKLTQYSQTALKLPRTTDEMFSLFDVIKGLRASTTDAKWRVTAYPLSYSGQDDYSGMLFMNMWPQYDGAAAYNALEGKNAAGNEYTPQIFNGEGRLKAMTVVRDMLARSSGYVNQGDFDKEFTKAQLEFLRGEAFFGFNGDWLEREASATFKPGDADVAFMRPPIISALGTKLGISDAKLIECIDYVDGLDGYDLYGHTGRSTAKPSGVSESQLDTIAEARRVHYNDSTSYLMCVPAFSPRLTETKDFLRFILSKEGQEVMMESSCGNSAPISGIDMTQFEFYKNDATYLRRSITDIFNNSVPFAETKAPPMQYLGQLSMTRFNESPLGKNFGGSTVTQPSAIQSAEYTYWNDVWSKRMEMAGLS